MGFVSLAHPPRLDADSALTLAYLARRAGHMERARRDAAPPTLRRAFQWEVSPRRFAQDVCGLTLDDAQIAVLVDPTCRRLLGNQSRQSGKSLGAAVCAAHHALFNPERRVLCVAPSLRQTKNLMRTIRAVLRASRCVPAFVVNNVFEIELPNGSEVLGLAAREDTIRSHSNPSLIIIDEASRVADDVYEAVFAMQATNTDTGRFLAISTPWGQRGWWWKAWTKGGESWARASLAATDCPRISAEHLREARLAMSEAKFRSEYLCEFLAATGEQPFPPALLDRIFREVADLEAPPSDAMPIPVPAAVAVPDEPLTPDWLRERWSKIA